MKNFLHKFIPANVNVPTQRIRSVNMITKHNLV
jgi:hypothetical protein